MKLFFSAFLVVAVLFLDSGNCLDKDSVALFHRISRPYLLRMPTRTKTGPKTAILEKNKRNADLYRYGSDGDQDQYYVDIYNPPQRQ